jgi:hypothetical protein
LQERRGYFKSSPLKINGGGKQSMELPRGCFQTAFPYKGVIFKSTFQVQDGCLRFTNEHGDVVQSFRGSYTILSGTFLLHRGQAYALRIEDDCIELDGIQYRRRGKCGHEHYEI